MLRLIKISLRKPSVSKKSKKLIRQDLGGSGPGLTHFIFYTFLQILIKQLEKLARTISIQDAIRN